MSLPGLTPPKTKLPPAPAKVEAPPIEVPPVEAPPASAATPPTSTDAPAGVAAPSASTPVSPAAPPTVKPVNVPGLAPVQTRVSTAAPKPAIDTSAARRAVYDTSRRARERGERLDTDQVVTAAAASLGVSPADLERTAGVDLRPYINPGDRDFRSLELDERDAEKAPPGGIRTVTTNTVFTDPGYAFGGLAGKDHPAFKAFMAEAEKFAAENPDVMTSLQSVDKSLTLADSKSKILRKLIRDKGVSDPAALSADEFDRLNKKALRLAVADAVRGRDLPGGAFGDLGINFPQSALSGDTYEDYVREGRLGRAALTAVKDNPVHVVGLDTFGNLVIMDKTTADKVFKFDDLIMSAAIGAGQGAGKIATDIRRGKDVNLTDIPYQMGRAMSMGEEPVERLGRTYGTLGERTARLLATSTGADAESVQDASTAGRVAGAAFGAAAGLGASLFAPGLGTDVVLPMSIAGASKGLSRLTPVRPTQPPATAASAFEAPPGEGAPIVTALESLSDRAARDAAAERLEEIGEALMTGNLERAAELEQAPLDPNAAPQASTPPTPAVAPAPAPAPRAAPTTTPASRTTTAPSAPLPPLPQRLPPPSEVDIDEFIRRSGFPTSSPSSSVPTTPSGTSPSPSAAPAPRTSEEDPDFEWWRQPNPFARRRNTQPQAPLPPLPQRLPPPSEVDIDEFIRRSGFPTSSPSSSVPTTPSTPAIPSTSPIPAAPAPISRASQPPEPPASTGTPASQRTVARSTGGSFRGDAPEAVALLDREDRNVLSIVETMLGDAPSRRLLTDQAWAPSVLDADQFILKVGDKDIKPLRGLPAASGSVRRAAPATSQAESAFALYDFKGRLDILAAARKRVKELAATGDLPVDSVGWRRLLRGVQGAPLSKEGDKRLLAAFRKPRVLSPEDSAKYDAAIDAIQKELNALITPGYAKDDAAPARIAEQAKRSLAAFRSLVDPEKVNRATLAAVRRQKAKDVLANRDRAKFIADADDVSRSGRLLGDAEVPADMVEPASLENYGDGTSKVTDLKVAKLKDGTWAILRGGPDDVGVQGEEVLASLAASDEAALAEAIAENTDPQDVLNALAPAQIQRLVASETAEEVLESALTPDAFMDTIRYAYDTVVDLFDGVGVSPERVARVNEEITRRLLVDAPDVLRLWDPGESIYSAVWRAKRAGVDPAQIDLAEAATTEVIQAYDYYRINSNVIKRFEGLQPETVREVSLVALRAAVRVIEKLSAAKVSVGAVSTALDALWASSLDIQRGVDAYRRGAHPHFNRTAWSDWYDLPVVVFDALKRGDDAQVDAFVEASASVVAGLGDISRDFRRARTKAEQAAWLADLRHRIYAMEREIEAKRLDLSKAPEPEKPAEPGAAGTSTPVGTSAEVEDAKKIAANALARVAIKSESTWLDRAKAGKRGRKRILEVIRAARDKQGRARNRLGSNVALITDNDYDVAKHFISSIGTKRLEQVALAVEPSVRYRTGIFDNEPLGVNYMASQVIGISHLAISTGRFTSTVIHELWHTLSQFIPKDTLADMYRQFVMERAAFAVANPGAFDAAGRLRVINYVEGQSTYRYASFDEWVVEKMTDLSISDAVGKISTKRIREQGTKVFMSPGMQALRALRALAQSTYHQVEAVHGADAVREAFLDFQSGLFLERLRDTSLAAISEVNEAERALQAKWTAFIADLAAGKPPEVAREDFVGATRDFLNSMAWRSPDRITGAEDTIDGGLDALEEIQSAAAIIPPQFVSRLEAALETFPGKRATIDQIEAYLKKSKVKDVELEMAGFQAFKDDLAARGVKSVTLDEARQSLKAAQDRFAVVGGITPDYISYTEGSAAARKEIDSSNAAAIAASAAWLMIEQYQHIVELAHLLRGSMTVNGRATAPLSVRVPADARLLLHAINLHPAAFRWLTKGEGLAANSDSITIPSLEQLRQMLDALPLNRETSNILEGLRHIIDEIAQANLDTGTGDGPMLSIARSLVRAAYEANRAAQGGEDLAKLPRLPAFDVIYAMPPDSVRALLSDFRSQIEDGITRSGAFFDRATDAAASSGLTPYVTDRRYAQWSINGGSDYAEIRVVDDMQQPENTAWARYHFEDTTAVHARVKTRDSSEGPVLGMDEMQSDHYQAKPVGEPPPEGEPDNRPKVAGEGVFAGDRWKYAGIRAAVIEAARRGLNGVAAPDGALAANAVGATLEAAPKTHEALVAFYDAQVPRLMKDVARDLGLAVREIDVPDYGRKVTAIMFDGKAVQGVPLFAKGAKKADVPAIKPPPEIVPVVPLPVNRPGSYVNVQFASPVDAAVYLWVQKGDDPAAQRALADFYKAATGRDLDIGEVTANISKITAAAKAEVDALKTLSKSADKPTIVKVKPLIGYIEGTAFDGWKIASKERLALEGAGPALIALKDRLAANLTADQVVARVNGYRDAAVKAFRNDKQGKRSIVIAGDTPEEIDAIAAAVDERLAVGSLTLEVRYTNPTNKTYFVKERIQPGAIEVAPPAAKPAPAAKVQHPKLSKELASAPLNVRGKRVSFASDLDRAAFVVTRAKTPEDAAEYLKFVSDATGMDEAAVRAHGAKVAKAIGDQAAKAKESTAFTLARVYDGAVVDTKAAATPAATAAPTPTPAAVVDAVDAPTVIAPARPTAPPLAPPPAAPTTTPAPPPPAPTLDFSKVNSKWWMNAKQSDLAALPFIDESKKHLKMSSLELLRRLQFQADTAIDDFKQGRSLVRFPAETPEVGRTRAAFMRKAGFDVLESAEATDVRMPQSAIISAAPATARVTPGAPTPPAPPAAPAPAAPTPPTPTAPPRKPYQLVARIGVNRDGDVDIAEIVGKADLVDLRALYNRLTSVGAGKGDVDAADVPFDIASDLAANERAAKALFAPISARASSPPTPDEASVGKAIEALDAFFAGVSDLHAQARQYRAARGEKEALAEIDEVIDATLMAAEIRGLAAYRAAAALRAGAATPLYGDVPEVRAVTQAVIDRPGFATKLREVVNKAAGGVIPNAPIARVAYGEGSSVPLIVDTASTQRLRALSRPMSGEVDKTIAEKVKIAADAEPNAHTVLIRFQGEDVYYTPEKFEEILDRAVSEYAAAEQAARASGKTGLNLNVLLARANRDFGVELVERRAVKIPDAVIAKDDAAIAAALAGGRHTWKPHEVDIDRMFNDTNGDVPPPGHGFVHAPVPVFRSRVLEPKAIPSIRSDLSSNEAIDVESVFPRATPRRRGASISIRSFTEAVDQALAAPFLQDGSGPGAIRTVLRKMVLPFIGEASALPFLRAPASLRPFMATLANEVEQGIGDMVVMLRQAPSGDLIFRYLSGEPGLVTPFGIPVASAGRINAAENARATMTRLYDAFLSGGENSPGAQVVKGFTYTGTERPVTQADLLAGAVAAARAARKSGEKFNVVGWINSTFDLPRDPKGAPLDKDAIGAATTAINNAISAITGARVISAGKDAAVGDQAVADIAPDFLRDMRKILLSQGETALGRTPPTDLPLIDLLTDPDPNYNDPEQVRALVNSLVSIIATSTLDDLAINRRAVNLVVHMAAYAQATHGLVRLSRTGVAITPDQFNLITRALNSEYLEEAERAEAERLVRVFGLVEGSDMERIDITGEDIYVPRSVAQILAQAFSKAKPIELAAFGRGKDALAARGELIARSASTAVVRGNILLKNSKMVQDTVDGFFRVMTMTDPSVTARYTARTASAAIYGLIPGLAPMIQIARQTGQELDVVGRLADGGQAAATAINRYVGALSDTERAAFHAKVEDMLKLGMQRPSVLAVWRGDNAVIPTAIGQTTARELRDVAQQHGVLSSFDTSQRVEASLRDLFGMTYAEAQRNPTAAVQNMIGRIKGLSPHIAKELLRSPLDALQWTREVTSSTMEQFSSMERLSLFVTLLEDGFDPVSAARSTSAILYNYGRTIHGADRSLFVALFLPFWAWRKNNNRSVLDLMFSQKGRVALMRARRAQAGIFGSAQSIIDAYTADEYGIDTEQMTPTQREMYYGMVFALEREHGYPLPVEQVAALRAVVSNQVGTTLQVGGEQYLTSGRPSTGFTQLAAKFLKAGAGGNPMLAAPGRANERYLRNVRGRAQVRMLQVDPNTASPQQIAAMIMQETETAAMIATAVNVLGVIGMFATGLINEGTTVIGKWSGASDMPYAIAPSELPFTAADAEMSPLYGQILAAWQGLTSPETDGMTRVPDEIGYLLASMGGDLVTIRSQPVAMEDPNQSVEVKKSYYVSTATWAAINLISIFALQDAKREFEQAAQAYKVAMEADDKDAAATAFETMITLLGYRIRRGADERIGTEGMDANSARRE